jgi:hypothetical protein
MCAVMSETVTVTLITGVRATFAGETKEAAMRLAHDALIAAIAKRDGEKKGEKT